MMLRLTGWVPLELFAASPEVRLTLNGQPVDRSSSPAPAICVKNTASPAPMLAGATRPVLVVEISRSGVAPGDTRELGLAISSLDWLLAARPDNP